MAAKLVVTKILGEFSAIREGESYRVEDFRQRAGLSVWQFHEAKCDGLKVRQVGKQSFVLGSDWLAFLSSQDRRRSLPYNCLHLAELLFKLIVIWFTAKK